MEPDLTKLAFYSGRNYMKREVAVGYVDFILGAFGEGTINVNHNLGHVPEYDVWVDYGANGVLWAGPIPFPGMGGGGTSSPNPDAQHWITANTLTMYMKNNTSGSITRRVHYLIYKDYS